MPPQTAEPGAPAPARPGRLRLILAGGAGVVALLALIPLGAADAQPVVALAAAVAGLTALLVTLGRDDDQAEPRARPAPAALEAATAPYLRLIDALPDPVMVISALEADDLTGRRFILVNAAAREVLRIRTTGGLLVTAIRDPDVLEAVDQALFGGIDAEAVYEQAGALERVLRAFAKPLGAAADGARLALLVLRDETELRRVERTRVDFLANASHELRTPLASLLGFIETLRGHARGDEGAREKFLGIMQTQAERMSRLIDDLMSLSRIELNEHVAPADHVDVAAAVTDVADGLAPLARERGVRIVVELPERGTAMVIGDRDQIVQVVQNLVDNALKYSPPDGVVSVVLESGLSAEAAGAARDPDAARLALLTPDHARDLYVAIRVSDQGVGLTRETLPRLTERFYRVEGQKSGERSGTGLGLAIVKHIMNRHRGGLAVESVAGRGAAFTAYFPLARDGRTPAAPRLVMKVS